MANVLITSCRNWRSFTSFTKFLNFSVRRMSSASYAVNSRRSCVDNVNCSPMLQCSQRNHFSSYSTLKRWQTFVYIGISLGYFRKISSSKIVYTHDEHDKGSDTVLNSSDSYKEDDTDSYDSSKVSYFESGSTNKAQPVSDADIDKDLLRYDYEEFELISDEQASIVQPAKKSVTVELKSK